MLETDFERAVVDAATLFGWRTVGHRPMRTKHGWATGWKYDGNGFPDLHLSHPAGYILIAELKVGTDLSDDQKTWQTHLTKVADNSTGRIMYRVWRPTNWDDIKHTLSFGKAS